MKFIFSLTKYSFYLLIFGLTIFLSSNVSLAATLENSYPRLANHFLKWEILDSEVAELAKWDLLTLDMEVQTNSPEQLAKIRRLNPDIIILAYINSVEILDNIENYNKSFMRNALAENIDSGWWLRDAQGKKIVNWPDTSMLNLTDLAPTDAKGRRFNDYLADFVVKEIKGSGLWDGVFYDNTWGDVAWINGGNIDADNNGVKDVSAVLDGAWAQGFKKVLALTRNMAGPDFIIVGNGRVYEGYQEILNGMMLEDFPSTWENGGTWTGSMQTYLKLPKKNVQPQVSMINSFSGNQLDYSHFRFGLTSTLLGHGFFSFDYGLTDHSQLWWYDEYNVVLGRPQSEAYNLLANKSTELKPGLWRRDFKFGSVIVNSTNKEQLHLFSKEEIEKIKGSQDPKFNTGLKISYLKLAPRDGAVLLRQSNSIVQATFVNGYFYRLYNPTGQQIRNGFFSYLNNYPGEAEVALFNDYSNGHEISVTAGFGEVVIYKNASRGSSFFPYTKNYRDRLNLAVDFRDNALKQIVVGPYKGGPQVTIFSNSGKMLGTFFAYDKNNRGGVQVALGDLDNDGVMEIVTGPGKGLEPLVKIFTLGGILKHSFLAYDINFKGGVSIAVGDVNNDGYQEIITGPGPGGGPHVRVFTPEGEVLNNFFAYDKNYRDGLKISVGDINMDEVPDILVGIKNIY